MINTFLYENGSIYYNYLLYLLRFIMSPNDTKIFGNAYYNLANIIATPLQ